MEIPSVSGMFQSRVGSIWSQLSSSTPGAASFDSFFQQALSGGQADGNLQQLTIVQGDGSQETQSVGDAQPADPTQADQAGGADTASSGLGSQIVSFAEQFQGTPYVWGGEDLKKGTDCSGFTQSVYAQFGIHLPRTAYRQSLTGTKVDPDNMQPGDLIFFKYCDRAPVTHVAMYIGNGQVIEAVPHGVSIKTLSGNWKKYLVSVKRMI